MTAAPRKRTTWSHCNECGHDTEHNIVHRASKVRSFDVDDRFSVEVGSNWTILQCGGCKEVAMRRVEWCSEDDPMGGPGPATYFPARVSRRKPDWLGREDVPDAYVGLLNEVYSALHADSRRLAMMGARAIIDAVIAQSVGDQGNFGQGLDALEKKELISKRDRTIIEAAIDAGSAAMHRGHQPTETDVNVAIDIVERMVHADILEAKAKALAIATPPRKRTASKLSNDASHKNT